MLTHQVASAGLVETPTFWGGKVPFLLLISPVMFHVFCVESLFWWSACDLCPSCRSTTVEPRHQTPAWQGPDGLLVQATCPWWRKIKPCALTRLWCLVFTYVQYMFVWESTRSPLIPMRLSIISDVFTKLLLFIFSLEFASSTFRLPTACSVPQEEHFMLTSHEISKLITDWWILYSSLDTFFAKWKLWRHV